MRKCRFCAEDIQDAAIVCPHCRRDLIPGRVTPSTETAPPADAATAADPIAADVSRLLGLNRMGEAFALVRKEKGLTREEATLYISKLTPTKLASAPAGRGSIICPNQNCGYVGPPKAEARGSAVVGLILCCFFLLPGLIYFMLKSGYRYSCPKCGLQISSQN